MKPRLERSSIAEIQASGVTLTSCECVAVAQGLMESEQAAEPRLPFGSPSPANVLIGSDGSVVCRGCAVTPTVLEIAILVHQLLPAGTPGVPGALRYTIARALHEVIAPPFDSLADFSRALGRFGPPDRARALRELYARGALIVSADDGRQAAFRYPLAAAIVAGFILIGAGQAMHRPGVVSRQSVALSQRSVEAAPQVLKPLPGVDHQSAVVMRQSVTEPAAAVAPSQSRAVKPQTATGRQAPPKPRPQAKKRDGFPSRVIARIRIEWKEL
jgi:hypothetical protein